MPTVIVKPRSRILHGHPWIYGTEIKNLSGDPSPGDIVAINDPKDRFLGSGIYNPQSQIVVRRFSFRRQELDAEFFRRRLERAAAYRATLPFPHEFCRLVWSESDGLPGVVIDRYDRTLVLQTLTLAMDQRRDMIVRALASLHPDMPIVERNDSPIRKAEGMELRTGVLVGEAPSPFHVEISGGRFTIDLLEGQKTGLYLDQLENYGKVAWRADGLRVLDAFCNQGGFAQACHCAGATSVTGVDVSGPSIEFARANAAAMAANIEFVESNCFDFLRQASDQSRTYDLIVLDPPSFTRNKKSLRDAIRGYKELHLRALKMLQPGGLLATFSCSHHIDGRTLLDIVNRASVDSRRTLRIVERFTQRADHPVIATIPETEYLRGLLLEVIGGW